MCSPPIIFLDVDGVLTVSRGLLWDFEDDDPTLVFPHQLNVVATGEVPIFPLEKALLQNLVWLVREANAKIVLSSTWRKYSLFFLEDCFKSCDRYPDLSEFVILAIAAAGLEREVVLGGTPDLPLLDNRAAEIQAWLDSNPDYKRFCIVDDGHEESFIEHGLGDRLVKTVMRSDDGDREKEGLTRSKAENALSILAPENALWKEDS